MTFEELAKDSVLKALKTEITTPAGLINLIGMVATMTVGIITMLSSWSALARGFCLIAFFVFSVTFAEYIAKKKRF